MHLSKKSIFITIFSLVVGFWGGFLFTRIHYTNNSIETSYAVRVGGYNFINPLLTCNISEDKQFSEYKPIANKFKEYINKSIANGNAQKISVYFRGLNTGHWSGVDENDVYSPASLLKVPLMIAYLKKADSDKNTLNKKITWNGSLDENLAENFKPRESIKKGESYTVEELIKYMIVYSDNNATTLLQKNIDDKSLIEVYTDLGMPASDNLQEETISPKVYSYIFRVLYNATYLSKPMSQYALDLLAKTDFSSGIKNGMPIEVTSAQKFGERTVINKDENTGKETLVFRELHDCGIVYYPRNPYLLCVMTKGSDFSALTKVISDISSIVYSETESGVLKI